MLHYTTPVAICNIWNWKSARARHLQFLFAAIKVRFARSCDDCCPTLLLQTCSFVKLARVSVTESDSLQLSNERQDIWYDVMNDKDVNNISRNFDFHRQHIIPCNAREIKNNFLDNLNC